MNARCNGTIYFGVEDGNDGRSQHGEIVGLWLSASERTELQKILDDNFTSELRI